MNGQSWYRKLKSDKKLFSDGVAVATKEPLHEVIGRIKWSRWDVAAMDWIALVVDYNDKEEMFWHTELEKV